ncbi:ABC transporter permease [Seohaeicola nanhaiensis]|uniref:ABC transporter permease n=1 Tax=Seohaeicola nanhaiensis TaxID=1387282 RepID=A0ABV9KIC4_9RHOB
MSVPSGPAPSRRPEIPAGLWAALLTLVAGALCLALSPTLPWLTKWPADWVLLDTKSLSAWLEAVLRFIRPAARLVSAVLAYPMGWANALFLATPWPLFIGLVTALGWLIGGSAMALLGGLGLGFVLISGYWVQGMSTLALVAVSVPVALLAGMAIGLLANEIPRVKGAVQALLDVMQTVPTFAYLTPLVLLFGFGPVVGLIASAIYAAPPMARNVILGLERVETDVKEAAVMSGATRWQQLVQVEIPSAGHQIMIGFNQCLMAALSMVIIAAVIGGFNDIGWEVLLTMRKAQFGQSFLAGLVIVAFAMVIDRMSGALAFERARHDRRVALAILGLALIVTLAVWRLHPDPARFTLLAPAAEAVDKGLGAFTSAYGASLDHLKNSAMFFGLLPLRIGLDDSVLPFTWGFQWKPWMSAVWYAAALGLGLLVALRGRPVAGVALVIGMGILETGIAQLPWPFVLIGTGALGHAAGGRRLSALSVGLLTLILVSGLWERALLSLYLCFAAVFACAVVGGAIGLASAVSPTVWRIVRPICDMLQTIPLFVFLIPVLMFFQIGEFSAFLAICAYAVVPMIRYTRHGLTETPPEMVEAATASGATTWQMLRDVRAPYAAPTILLGLNQTILYAFAMLVIAALIGTTGLGQSIFLALGQADIGLGVSAGAAMAILAFIADRLVQGFARGQREALGL